MKDVKPYYKPGGSGVVIEGGEDYITKELIIGPGVYIKKKDVNPGL